MIGEGRNGEEYELRLLLELAVNECRLSYCGRDTGDVAEGGSSCTEFRGRAVGSSGSRAGSFIAFKDRLAENDADWMIPLSRCPMPLFFFFLELAEESA